MHRKQLGNLDDFMTAGAVAKFFGVSRGLVYQWRARGKLHPAMVGRAVMFYRPEVEALRKAAHKAGSATTKRVATRGHADVSSKRTAPIATRKTRK